MRPLNHQIQDVPGNPGPERSPRLPVRESTSTPGAVATVGTHQLSSGEPARPGRTPAWPACEVNRAITNGIGRPASRPGSRDHHVV
jgi:hypothetical protein